jgi:hypothetical protein
MSINPGTGRDTPMQVAYPDPLIAASADLPDGYEFSSAVKLLRAEITLNSTNFDDSYLPITEGGEWHLIVWWEPNTDMSEAEKNRLFALCNLTCNTKILKNQAT